MLLVTWLAGLVAGTSLLRVHGEDDGFFLTPLTRGPLTLGPSVYGLTPGQRPTQADTPPVNYWIDRKQQPQATGSHLSLLAD